MSKRYLFLNSLKLCPLLTPSPTTWKNLSGSKFSNPLSILKTSIKSARKNLVSSPMHDVVCLRSRIWMRLSRTAAGKGVKLVCCQTDMAHAFEFAFHFVRCVRVTVSRCHQTRLLKYYYYYVTRSCCRCQNNQNSGSAIFHGSHPIQWVVQPEGRPARGICDDTILQKMP